MPAAFLACAPNDSDGSPRGDTGSAEVRRTTRHFARVPASNDSGPPMPRADQPPDPVAAPGACVAAEMPRYMTVRETAALLRINVKTAYDWALKGRLPGAFRLGGNEWRVCRERLLRYVRENSASSSGETER